MNIGRECLWNLSKHTEQEEKDTSEIEEISVPEQSLSIYLGYWKPNHVQILNTEVEKDLTWLLHMRYFNIL